MPWDDLITALGGGLAVFPADDPFLGGVADVDFALELPFRVLEAGAVAALGQAELVDRLLALAAEQDGDLAEIVGELRGPEAGIGQVGHGLTLLVGRGPRLPGVVHGDEDGARLEEDGG